ncbi:MAG: TraR/DksA C4-type zinc finger protein [Patescibacteria group bacterium]
MDANFITEMKEKLESERTDLRKRLGLLGPEDKKVKDDFHAKFPQYGSSEEDNATEVAQYQDNVSLEGNLEGRLKEVEEALVKINKGGYGRCENCQEEIPRERLEVNPAAAICVKCKDL